MVYTVFMVFNGIHGVCCCSVSVSAGLLTLSLLSVVAGHKHKQPMIASIVGKDKPGWASCSGRCRPCPRLSQL
jgi:hypothetical protein